MPKPHLVTSLLLTIAGAALLTHLWFLGTEMMRRQDAVGPQGLHAPVVPQCRQLGLIQSVYVQDFGQLCLMHDGSLRWLPSDLQHRVSDPWL